jgi:hypothetical protein
VRRTTLADGQSQHDGNDSDQYDDPGDDQNALAPPAT